MGFELISDFSRSVSLGIWKITVECFYLLPVGEKKKRVSWVLSLNFKVFEAGCYILQTDLIQLFCLHFSSIGITGVQPHTRMKMFSYKNNSSQYLK